MLTTNEAAVINVPTTAMKIPTIRRSRLSVAIVAFLLVGTDMEPAPQTTNP